MFRIFVEVWDKDKQTDKAFQKQIVKDLVRANLAQKAHLFVAHDHLQIVGDYNPPDFYANRIFVNIRNFQGVYPTVKISLQSNQN